MEGAIVVSATDKPAYDAMLANKSQFWEEIARRKVSVWNEWNVRDVRAACATALTVSLSVCRPRGHAH